MTVTDTAADTKVLDKIMKLLAKAEGTDNEAEAAIFMAKAQKLMTQHSIAEATLRASGQRPEAEVETRRFEAATRTWWSLDSAFLQLIAKANDCQAYGTPAHGKADPFMTVVGYPEDLANVAILYVSLQTQLTRALKGTPSNQAWRRAFRIGFAVRVGERLAEARAHVVEEEAEHTPSLLPMLADKAAQVGGSMPGGLRTTRHRSRSASGLVRGRAAGDRADVGAVGIPTSARGMARNAGIDDDLAEWLGGM